MANDRILTAASHCEVFNSFRDQQWVVISLLKESKWFKSSFQRKIIVPCSSADGYSDVSFAESTGLFVHLVVLKIIRLFSEPLNTKISSKRHILSPCVRFLSRIYLCYFCTAPCPCYTMGLKGMASYQWPNVEQWKCGALSICAICTGISMEFLFPRIFANIFCSLWWHSTVQLQSKEDQNQFGWRSRDHLINWFKMVARFFLIAINLCMPLYCLLSFSDAVCDLCSRPLCAYINNQLVCQVLLLNSHRAELKIALN